MTMQRRSVLLFTRRPDREARAKGLAGGAPLFASLRDRTITAVAVLPDVDLVVVGDPGAVRLPAGSRVLPQRGSSFAARLENAFADVRALGYDEIVAVGTDALVLDVGRLAAAFEALRSRPLALGPARDGGVYLLGLRGDAAGLLRGIPWQTGRVFAALLERCPGAAVLPESLLDVDGRADLPALLAEASIDPELAALIRRLLRHRPPARPLRVRVFPSRPFLAPSLWRGPPLASGSATA